MPRVTIELPSLLGQVTGGARRVEVEAELLSDALEALFDSHPELRVHLFDESGRELREHVLCLHNDDNTRHLGTLEVALREGDRITIMQAVSGG